MFCDFSTVVFHVIISSGACRLSVSGKTRFLPALQAICRFRNFIRIN